MDYSKILEYVLNIPMFQNVGKEAYNPSLKKTVELLDFLDNPQNKFKSIHIAGTNGKGSSSAMLGAILRESGLKVGLYTSPHMIDYRERIVVDNSMISKQMIEEFFEICFSEIERLKPSFFEFTTVLAFWAFAKSGVDIAVIETGLGGRIDSTNIINPLVSLITNIGIDHKNILGTTLPEIAGEKAGIIKPNIPVIVSERNSATEKVFENRAKECGSDITFAQDKLHIKSVTDSNNFVKIELKNSEGVDSCYLLNLVGGYQAKNLLGVLCTIDALKKHYTITEQHIYNALQNCRLQGRWQTLAESPKVICDVGHNFDGLSEVVAMLRRCEYNKLFMVIGFMADKDVDEIIGLLPNAQYIAVAADSTRAMQSEVLQDKLTQNNMSVIDGGAVGNGVEIALKNATKDDLIFIGGSTFVVAEAVGIKF